MLKMNLNNWLTDAMKKRALRYLLHRYIGHFLLEKLTLDQLSVDLYDGRGSISDIVLDIFSLNEELSFLPLHFLDGCFIKKISVAVPWSSLLSDSCSLQIDGLSFICSVVNYDKNKKMVESNYLSKSLMTSSMQIAEEIVNESEGSKFEGLEMFADLLDSVLRRVKIIATNTSFIVTENNTDSKKDFKNAGIEFKIGFLKCEEQFDGNEENRDANSVKESISKILTLEGVEVFINGKCISKLNGKNTIKINANGSKSDLQINIGSVVFGVLNSEQINRFLNVFSSMKTSEFNSDSTGEKMMCSADFAKIEQQLQLDAANAYRTTNIVVSNSMNLNDQNVWTCGGNFNSCDSDLKFLPLISSNDKARHDSKQTDQNSYFSCYIKVPGIFLCLLHSSETSEPLYLPPIESSFDSINSYLNKILGSKKHIRCLALPVQLEIKNNGISFMCGDIMVSEQNTRGLNHIISSTEQESVIYSPKYICEISKRHLNLTINTSFDLTIDPTFLERLNDYFLSSDNSDFVDFTFDLFCDAMRMTLLIPIPDLRPECERSSNSDIRSERFILFFSKFALKTDLKTLKANAERAKGFIVVNNQEIEIVESYSCNTELLEIIVKRGPSASMSSNLEETIVNTLMEAEMEDSIYISNSANRENISPFRMKRKVIKEKQDDSEQIIAPNDREAAERFLDFSRTTTQAQVDVNLPFFKFKVSNKTLLELIYNRLGNDLVLWKPIYRHIDSKCLNSVSINMSPKPPTYFTCKSGLAESVDSDSSFHSFSGSPTNKMHSSIVCAINSDHVVWEMGEANDIQNISGNKILFGLVVGLDEESSNVVSLCGDNMSFNYNGGVVIGNNKYTNSTCSLNMSLDIHRESEDLKRVKFALQINDGAMYNTNFDLFKNFWTFVNVKDEAVLGYVSPSIFTELHIDLVNGGIAVELEKTRPALIAFDDAYITSMVVEDTSKTLLRFIIEEGSLYLKKKNNATKTLKNYVCVIDSGLIDLNLKISDDDKIEFKVSNNILNVRVCSDSLGELCELFKAIANSGDIVSEEPPCELPVKKDEPFPNEYLIQDALDESEEETTSMNESIEKNCNCNTSPESLIEESGFWILGDDDVGAGIKVSKEPQIRILTSEPIKILENHFGVVKSRPVPEITPQTVARYLLEEMSLVVNLYGGKDFEDTHDSCEEEKDGFDIKDNHFLLNEPRVKFAESTVHLWESLDLVSAPGVLQPHSVPVESSSNKNLGGKYRQNDVCVQIYFSKVKILFDKFDPSFLLSWRFIFMVNNIEIRDRVSASKINKMLYEYCSESMPRRNNASMVSIKATTHRNLSDNSEECDLKVSLKPLRINIDQDTVMFLYEFFTQLSTHQIRVDEPLSDVGEQKAPPREECLDASQNNDEDQLTSNAKPSSNVTLISPKPKVLYVKTFVFTPHVPIRLDYHGKRVDFEKGALPGLLMGLAQLNQSELCLKRLHEKRGFLGFDRVFLHAIREWTSDIKKHQLPSLLGGVGPMHSFIQLFQGVRDLLWMPIDQYRKDRRFVRGLQRGASSFSNSTAMAIIDLANRFVYVIQGTAQFAHDVVSPPVHGRHNSQRMLLPTSQPRDFREGMVTALTVMREGINETVRNVASAGMQADDVSSAIGVVIRQIPSAIFRPVIQASQATSNVLMGMRNQLTPEARKEDQDKWKNS
ncbi:autophagy-related protein 2B-like protein [Dinothrombium tinctorium]|uniref:Autophagy-related protein 2 n=1 Tax=Dinothrombium tinctorium TaxID=1965070 RepID=A0A3S4QKU4_9ACAR|nr:autophagy-related protein 2B-like protein [Dinothrombium tinctorium]RWS04715.1 autophagy-related protein 2B-like protein [Dinothrombium tinctorium]